MINPYELRIGNVIAYETTPCYVESISIHSGIGTSVGHENDLFIFNPILITEEVLLKCGFTMRLVNGHIPECSILCTPPNYKNQMELVFTYKTIPALQERKFDSIQWRNVERSGDSHSFNIKSLHQLQNIYFVLTDEELKVVL